ncbi:MAG: hypothetical protein WA137_05120 [Methanothrix sp.]
MSTRMLATRTSHPSLAITRAIIAARILPGGKATLWASGCFFAPYALRLLAALLHTPK